MKIVELDHPVSVTVPAYPTVEPSRRLSFHLLPGKT
jgi:hypothetical protein